MSKENNLTDFLTDVADAIREKKGTSEKINPQNFSEEIRSIQSGGEVNTFGEVMTDSGLGIPTVKRLEFSPGITTIADNAYQYLTSIESVDLPDSITSIGSYAFRGCASLRSIRLPKKITSIPNYFIAQTSVANIELSDSIVELGDAAFYIAPLTTIDIPNSVKNIGNWCFESCSSLKSVHIGTGIEYIASGAFVRCSKLEDVIIDAIKPPILYNSTVFESTIKNIYVPDSYVDNYKSATNWSKLAAKIKPISEYQPNNE
jgi:hypothetical protein